MKCVWPWHMGASGSLWVAWSLALPGTGNITFHEKLSLDLLETLLYKWENMRFWKISAQCQGSSQEWAGMKTEQKTHPPSYFQPQNLPVPFPGVYSGGPWGVTVLGQTACSTLKMVPFPFAWVRQSLIYWGFLSGLPTSQIYRISEPVRQNGFITH